MRKVSLLLVVCAALVTIWLLEIPSTEAAPPLFQSPLKQPAQPVEKIPPSLPPIEKPVETKAKPAVETIYLSFDGVTTPTIETLSAPNGIIAKPAVFTLPKSIAPMKIQTQNLTLPAPAKTAGASSVVENWQQIFYEDFEGTFPATNCTAFANLGSYDAYWGSDDFNPYEGTMAGWPAKDGAGGVDPAIYPYPRNLESWLKCGPFDFSSAEKIRIKFNRWLETTPTADDKLFAGISLDGTTFTGNQWDGIDTTWREINLYSDDVAGAGSVWVAWQFRSTGADMDTMHGSNSKFGIYRPNNLVKGVTPGLFMSFRSPSTLLRAGFAEKSLLRSVKSQDVLGHRASCILIYCRRTGL